VFKSGVLVSGTLNNAKVIRIEPPLTISYEKIDQSLRAMHKALKLMRRKDLETPTTVRAKL
jgi:putrescine aminotransferase